MTGHQLLHMFLLFTLSGCGTLHHNTHEDQATSLEKYAQEDIDAWVIIPGSDEKKRLSPKKFLTLHSGTVIAGEEFDQKVRESFTSHIEYDESSLSYQWEFTSTNKIILDPGSCVPISLDGYFLTAAHAINKPNPFVICLSSVENKPYLALADCRVVMMETSADVAIFKAKVMTPWYLQMRDDPLDSNEIVFAGGWMHKRGAGKHIDTEIISIETNGKQIKHSCIETSIPIIRGDSGSPLINQRGELLGVMSKYTVGKWRKLSPKSKAVMLDVGFINEIIDKDRQQMSSQHPASRDRS